MLGILWNWTLYGVLVVQLYVYSYNFPEDRRLLKLLVYSVFLVETVQTALTGADLYFWFVSGFGDIGGFSNPYMSSLDVPIIGSIIAFTVQLFFVYRIWVLSERSSRSWFLCLIICLCSTVDTGAALYWGINTYLFDLPPAGFVIFPMTVTWLSGNTLSDLLITGSMLYHLRRRRRDASSHFSDHALTRIVRLTVETNVLTTFVGIVSILMVVIYPGETWFICPVSILGKLYSNTLLVSLNNRVSIREGRGARNPARSTAVTFALTTDSGPVVDIVQVELPVMKPLGGSLEDSAGQGNSRLFDIA